MRPISLVLCVASIAIAGARAGAAPITFTFTGQVFFTDLPGQFPIGQAGSVATPSSPQRWIPIPATYLVVIAGP